MPGYGTGPHIAGTAAACTGGGCAASAAGGFAAVAGCLVGLACTPLLRALLRLCLLCRGLSTGQLPASAGAGTGLAHGGGGAFAAAAAAGAAGTCSRAGTEVGTRRAASVMLPMTSPLAGHTRWQHCRPSAVMGSRAGTAVSMPLPLAAGSSVLPMSGSSKLPTPSTWGACL